MADIQTQLPVRSDIEDDSAFVIGTTEVFPWGALADETAPDSVDEGDIGILRMTLTRLLKVKMYGDDGGSDVALNVDSSGNVSVTTALDSEYAEDTVHTDGDVGQFVLAVRNDAGTALAADGDYIPLSTDSDGNLRVTGGGSNPSVHVDDAAFTIATDSVTASGYLADETAPDSVDEGDIGLARMTLDRRQIMVLSDATTESQRLAISASGEASVLTNFEYDEDTVHGDGDTGAFVLAVRNDTLAALAGTDGDYAPLQVDADGALYVTGSFSNPSVHVDDAAFTIATDSVTACGYLADETTPDSVDEGDIGLARMTLDRRQLMVITDATTESQRLAINASGEAEVISNFEYDEDAVHGDGDTGAFVLAVRNDTLAALAGTDGDYAPLQVDADGALYVNIGDRLTTNYEYAEDSVHTSGDTGAFILAVQTEDQGALAGNDDYAPLQVNEDGLLRVTIGATTDTANAIANYGTVASVADAATGTISYDRTGLTTTFLLKQIIATSSGAPCKVVVTHSAGATTVAVGFYATSSPVINYTFAQPIPVTNTSTTAVSVAITNNAGLAQDVYATIIGEEV